MDTEKCISCGRDDRPLLSIDGAFLPDNYKVCVSCAFRYKSGLPEEADRLMVEYQVEPNFNCLRCGCQVIPSDEVPLYCLECSHEIYATFKGLVK